MYTRILLLAFDKCSDQNSFSITFFLVVQEPDLDVVPGGLAIASWLTRRLDHPVAGDDQADGIRCHSGADGSSSQLGPAAQGCQMAIAHSLSKGNFLVKSLPNLLTVIEVEPISTYYDYPTS